MGPLRPALYLAASALCLLAAPARAAAAEPSGAERYDAGWALSFDDDFFSPHRTDRDYTAGLSLTLSGLRARDAWWSLDRLRAGADRLLGLDALYAGRAFGRHSAEAGVMLFTPRHISVPAEQAGDRPYASLIYLANTGIQVEPDRGVAWLSTFTLGVLGAPIAGEIQKALHRVTGSPMPRGWGSQISRGGEPTFGYAFARIERAWHGRLGGTEGEVTGAWRAAAGYITEASYGIAARFGEIRTPWWSHHPQLAEYAEKSIPVVASDFAGPERYLWTGFAVRARAYDAFLQGQFRHSTARFASGELNPLVLVGWVGYTRALANGWRFSYVLRMQSPEVRGGPAHRADAWGGITVSYAR